MKLHTKKRLKSSSLTGLLAFLPSLATADAAVSGFVKNASETRNIEGALVTIRELNLKTVTNRAGQFHFPKVAEGQYTLEIQYLGYKPQTKTLVVKYDTVDAKVSLERKNQAVEEVRVYGQSAAINSSINRQRNADGVVSVMDTKAMGDFPDQNISETLQRLAGISIERDQGEGRYVTVRGMNADYNSVTVNGVNVPSPSDDRRAVALDVVPNDLVGSVAVTKTLTPDMDADGLGGAIEITSLSAFDREKATYKVLAEAGYNELTEKVSPKMGVTLTETFSLAGKEDALGVAFSASWYDREFGSDNVETGGKWAFDAGTLEGLEEVEHRDYTINRERLGLGLNLDLRAFEGTDLYFRSMYASFEDEETRFANKVEFDEAVLPGNVTEEESTVVRELKDRIEKQAIQSFTLGGQTRLDAWTFDYSLGLSTAEEKKDGYIDGAAFEADVAGLGFRDSEKPALIANADFFDVAAYELDKVEMAESSAEDTQSIVKWDVTRDLFIAEKPTSIKAGVKYSQREKTSKEDVYEYETADGEEALTLADVAAGTPDYALGPFGNTISKKGVLNALSSLDGSLDDEKSAVNDYTIEEDILSAYGMVRTDIGQLRLIAGVRMEQTNLDLSGSRYDDEEEAVYDTSFSTDETRFMPAILARYDINDQMLVRAGWTNTLSRPTFEQLSPGAFLENGADDGEEPAIEGEAGNPYLDTMTSSNLDIGFEFYPGDVSVISAGVFYKQIEDFIYKTELSGDYRGLSEDYTLETWRNGDSADLFGLELNYLHQFETGFMLGANLTWIDSTATISDGETSRDISLPGQSDYIGNLLLGYEMDRYSVRLSGNFKTKSLIEFGEIETQKEDIYEDASMHWDFVAKARLYKNISASFKVVNLTDEPYYAYQYQSDYNYQYEEYGRTFQLGIEIANF